MLRVKTEFMTLWDGLLTGDGLPPRRVCSGYIVVTSILFCYFGVRVLFKRFEVHQYL